MRVVVPFAFGPELAPSWAYSGAEAHPMAEVSLSVMRRIQQQIVTIRGCRVMLDADLARLYEVDVKALNQAVKRNLVRFPADFTFQLTREEAALLRSQTVTLDAGRGSHRKYRPYAFTEQGVSMLSSVLRSPRAVLVNIEIMRVFVHLRHALYSNADLARRLMELEHKSDTRFRAVFDAIRSLTSPPQPPRRRIGFRAP
jgi:hypothetical protein